MKVPATRPEMTSDEVQMILNKYPEVDHFDVKILGIRGYYLNTMGATAVNDRGIYDDAIFIITPTLFRSYNANTDPSIKRKRIAVLKPGVHMYRKGKHGISRPSGGYPALRPATPGERLPVVRDGVGESMGIAINIHSGSLYSTSSEGCQTIYKPQWAEFIKTVYEEMDRYHQAVIPYILHVNG